MPYVSQDRLEQVQEFAANNNIDIPSYFESDWEKEGRLFALEGLLEHNFRGDEIEVREHYSGRGMFGKSTRAVVVHDYPMDAASSLAQILDLRQDSMGFGIVIY